MRRILVITTAAAATLALLAPAASADDWALDPSWADAGILQVTTLPDAMFTAVDNHAGKVVAAGEIYQGKNSDVVVGVTSSGGVLDPSFSDDGVTTRAGVGGDIGGTGLDVGATGVITVAASYARRLGIYQWTSTGTPNTAFSHDGLRVLRPNPVRFARPIVATDGLGRVIVAVRVGPSKESNVLVIRLQPNGALDQTFSGDGMRAINDGKVDWVDALTTDSQNRILIGTSVVFDSDRRPATAIRRWTATGRDDHTFSTNGRLALSAWPTTGNFTVAIEAQPDAITVALTDFQHTYGVARLTNAGRFDPSYGDQGRISINCRCVMWGADVRQGQAALFGLRTSGPQFQVQVLARIGSDGTQVIVGEFDIQAGTLFDYTQDVMVMGDKTITVGNAFSDSPIIARLE